MYETVRIVDKLKPKYVIWENVKNLLSKKHRHNFDNYLERMENMGYRNYYQVLNAKDYGIPQNRERVFTISIRADIEKEFHFPEKEELKLRLKDMLEEQVDEKYYLSDKGIKYVEKRDGGYTQIATEQTEIAHCPITAKGNDNWTGNFIKQVAQMYGTEREPNPQAGRVYDSGGGNRMPKIVVDNPLKGKTDMSWQFEQQVFSEDGITRAIKANGGSGNIPKLLIKNNTQQGYLEAHEGDGVYTNTSTKRGTVQPQMMHTISTIQDCGVVVADERNKKEQLCDYLVGNDMVKENDVIRHSYSQSRQDDWEHRGTETHNISPTLDTRSDCLGVATKDADKLRIRKLTPKECWRLMGFHDDEFERAAVHNSNSQLYKQARKLHRC